MKHKAACLLLSLLAVPAATLSAFGNLSADEVRTLFSGQTVEGEFRGGTEKYLEPGGVDVFAEPFVMYFSGEGAVRSLRGGKKRKGTWRVDGKGNLCVQWKGKKEGCAPVTREGSVYKKYMRRGGGRIKWVRTFNKFTPGNTGNL